VRLFRKGFSVVWHAAQPKPQYRTKKVSGVATWLSLLGSRDRRSLARERSPSRARHGFERWLTPRRAAGCGLLADIPPDA